ncbi:uncharacterized protein PHACADRAFT_162124 [Phanerochaete carnosa HHB-10118-sp]|uniref:Glucose-methanol-choline oxidoreductase C-terminal domain-containing protein n=1 Tax=Phanerochaete carnosa (strain HHB-10118-sp) TaxID=650164 RepID=K5WAR2_PHACS|nr:uncharacterized protein PHACADRAFT_162124 [Phanerochaete carnosa HHB-10118-sp]EKM56079.1 hypothetical protein PHACADRAFT_162124 [Phanerochaete carnosa HHB-10118-sp]
MHSRVRPLCSRTPLFSQYSRTPMAGEPADIQDIADKTFDYVVIGCVIASRLSEDPDVTVALLEAGPPHLNDLLVRDPAACLKLLVNSEYEYPYTTTPHKLRPPVSVWMTNIGKLGNEGWTWENFCKCHKKVQRCVLLGVVDTAHWPLIVRRRFYPSSKNELSEFKNLYNPDFVGGDGMSVTGTFKALSNIDLEIRQRAYSATTYLFPALDRPNLKVLTDAYVRKIVTDESGGDVAASGVEFEYGGHVYTVFIKKEVVLSVGYISTPLGTEVKVVLPSVRTNVQEHSSMGVNRWTNVSGLPDAIKMVVNSATFVPIQSASDRTDILVPGEKEKFAQNACTCPPGRKEQLEIQLQQLEDLHVSDFEMIFFPFMIHFFANPEPEKPYLNILSVLSRPFSRGSIHITSADPKADPAVNTHSYEEKIDLDIKTEAVKFVRKVMKTEPFSKIIEKEELPGPEVQMDEQLYGAPEIIGLILTPCLDTCGSNSMLPRDKGGVVDSKLKFHGTRNIRVVDLPILPLQTAVHPMGMVHT